MLPFGCDEPVTVTWKETEPVLPAASVAVHVTRVVPMGKRWPEAGRQVVTTLESTASMAPAVKVTRAPDGEVACAEMSGSGSPPGSVMSGGVVSVTVTTNEALPVWPSESVAEQVTVVWPRPNVDPEIGAQAGVIGPSMSSDAEAE
jgi:hypothetical protein